MTSIEGCIQDVDSGREGSIQRVCAATRGSAMTAATARSDREARRPRYWRELVVDGERYVWKASLGRDRYHSGVRVAVRAADDGATGAARAPRGSTLLVQTSIGGALACHGPQCPRLEPARPIGPRHVAEMVRKARALRWTAGAGPVNTRFECNLASAEFVADERVELTRRPP